MNAPKWMIKAIDKIRRSFIEPTVIASVKLNTMFSSEPMQQLLIERYYITWVIIYWDISSFKHPIIALHWWNQLYLLLSTLKPLDQMYACISCWSWLHLVQRHRGSWCSQPHTPRHPLPWLKSNINSQQAPSSQIDFIHSLRRRLSNFMRACQSDCQEAGKEAF